LGFGFGVVCVGVGVGVLGAAEVVGVVGVDGTEGTELPLGLDDVHPAASSAASSSATPVATFTPYPFPLVRAVSEAT
jgi:hypothetical protein